MKTVTRQEINRMPADDAGRGYIYILESATMIKLGMTGGHPKRRVCAQSRIGFNGTAEPVDIIHLSEPMHGCEFIEKEIHLAAKAARHFAPVGPRFSGEIYPKAMLRTLRLAVVIAENGNCGGFAGAMRSLSGEADFVAKYGESTMDNWTRNEQETKARREAREAKKLARLSRNS